MSDRTHAELERAADLLVALLSNCLVNGFYGSLGVTVHIQDGHVQTIEQTTRRLEKPGRG